MKTETFEFNGYNATVITPDTPNGKCVWKTEFLYAFDLAEQMLLNDGYTRVYYSVSNMYGSSRSVRLMHAFHKEVIKRYNLETKVVLFGFSRGGLYAFNYALFYPEYVSKIYLDAPVLDLKSWPVKGSSEYLELLNEYNLDENTYEKGKYSPVDHMDEFLSLKIPTIIVAGAADEVVPLERNSKIMIDDAIKMGITIPNVIKPDCKHHPHSLTDIMPIIDFINESK